MPEERENFNVEDVRTAKIVGGNINDVKTIHGMVIRRNVEGSVRHCENAKVAVFGCARGYASYGDERHGFDSKRERIGGIFERRRAASGEIYRRNRRERCKVVFTGQSFGDLALHF